MPELIVNPYEVYAGYDEMPDDPPTQLDLGDLHPDSVIMQPTEEEIWAVVQEAESILASPAILSRRRRPVAAPLRRVLRRRCKGPDVVAMARALSKWEHRHGLGSYYEHPTPLFSDGKFKRVKRFQHRMGLKADGQYGEATHRKLLPYFDAWGATMMAHYHPAGKGARRAAAVVAQAMFAYHHAPRHYNNTVQTLRCQGWYEEIVPPSCFWYDDCSGFALHCDWISAGRPSADSGLLGWFGGWTGSMLEHGHRVPASKAKAGSFVFYNNHVAVKVNDAGEDKVCTHGHEGGPFYTSQYYRSDVLSIVEYYGR